MQGNSQEVKTSAVSIGSGETFVTVTCAKKSYTFGQKREETIMKGFTTQHENGH